MSLPTTRTAKIKKYCGQYFDDKNTGGKNVK